MNRLAFSVVLLAMFFAANAETFMDKLKNKLLKSIDKLPIPDSLKTEMLNSPEFKEILKNMNMDDVDLPDSVKEKILDEINFDEILKNVNLGGLGLPEATTMVTGAIHEELSTWRQQIPVTTERPFPTGISNEIIVGGENGRLDDLTDRVENLEEDVQELKNENEMGKNVNTTTAITHENEDCPENFERNPRNGKCYMFSRDQKSWHEAKGACIRLDAGLISIETESEYEMILKYITHTFETTDFYTSGNDIEEQLSFLWDSTGQPVTFSSWAPEEPNNQFGNERCLEIKYYLEFEKYYWNDLPCYIEKNYICESFE